jgi:hypothetical protein
LTGSTLSHTTQGAIIRALGPDVDPSLVFWLGEIIERQKIIAINAYLWLVGESATEVARITKEAACGNFVFFGLADGRYACWAGSPIFYDLSQATVLPALPEPAFEYRTFNLSALYAARTSERTANE